MTTKVLHRAMIEAADQAVEKSGQIDKAGAERIIDVMINGRGISVHPTLIDIQENYKITDEAQAVLDASNMTKFSLLPKNPYKPLNAVATQRIAIVTIDNTLYTLYKGGSSVYLNTFKYMLDDQVTNPQISGIYTSSGVAAELVEGKIFLITTSMASGNKNFYCFFLDPVTLAKTNIDPPHNATWQTISSPDSTTSGNTVYISWLNAATNEVCLGYYNIDREEYIFVSKGLGLSSDNTSDFAPSIIALSVSEKDPTTGEEVLIDKVAILWVGKGGGSIHSILYDPSQGTNGTFEFPFTMQSNITIQSPLTARLLTAGKIRFAAIAPHLAGGNWFTGVLSYTTGKPSGVYPYQADAYLPKLTQPIEYCELGNCLYLFYMDAEDNNTLKYVQI